MLKRPFLSQTDPRVHCGVDISKKTFNWHCQGVDGELPNDKAGFAQLLKQIRSIKGFKFKQLHVVMESTGGYENPLRNFLHDKDIALSLANPARVRAFAQSRGLAKTDRIDARAIAGFADSFPALDPLPATPAPAKEYRYLGGLCDARNQLVKIRTMILNQMGHLEGTALARHRDILESLERQIAGYEKDIHTHLLGHPALKVRTDLLEEVSGIGTITSTILVSQMPELGTLGREECARLAGLAPINRDSGTKEGKRKIQGGRATIRCALYMACRTAVTHNQVLKAFYERLRAKGKCDKVALTAVMRKMLGHLNSKMKQYLASNASAPA